MTAAIKRLITQSERLLSNGYISYDNAEDLDFVSSVLTALRDATPDLRALAKVQEKLDTIAAAIGDLCVARTITNRLALEEIGHVPSNAASPAPETAHSSHSRGENLNTDGNAASSGHKSGSAGTPGVSAAKLAVARRAATKRKPRAGSKAPPAASGADAGVPPGPPPANL
jgi:hypothetical protein